MEKYEDSELDLSLTEEDKEIAGKLTEFSRVLLEECGSIDEMPYYAGEDNNRGAINKENPNLSYNNFNHTSKVDLDKLF
ncbi:MAG: hypothetical protein ABEK17_00345 [Candidatus Aenigmatarchaeota archaeon]